MARPKKPIDAGQVESLAAIGCTVSEIAAVLKCDKRTIERRFAAELKDGRERLKASLRRYQLDAAKKGNASMLIWLGKQILGQRDQPKDTEESGDFAIDLSRPADEAGN